MLLIINYSDLRRTTTILNFQKSTFSNIIGLYPKLTLILTQESTVHINYAAFQTSFCTSFT